MIAATARAHGLPLYTLNVADLARLDDLIEIVDLG
jgi:predicted nucleic acid-binding protein